MHERVYKKPLRDVAQMKQRLVEVWDDFEQTIVDMCYISGGSDSGPVSVLQEDTCRDF